MTTKHDERLELLKAAAEIVRRVMGTLDTSDRRCLTCQLIKKNNWDESQLAQELDGIVRKLLKCAERLNALSNATEVTSPPSVAQ